MTVILFQSVDNRQSSIFSWSPSHNIYISYPTWGKINVEILIQKLNLSFTLVVYNAKLINLHTSHTIIWGLWCQTQLSQAWICNYTPQYSVMQLLIHAWDICFWCQSPHIHCNQIIFNINILLGSLNICYIFITYSISQEICTRFCCALLCCGYAIVHNEFTWSIYPYSSGLLCWHWGNR